MSWSKEKKAAYMKAYREANKEKIAAYNKAYDQTHKEEKAAQQKVYTEANREKKAAYDKANAEKIAAQRKAYNKENPEVQRSISAKRRAAKLQQTPVWYCHSDCVAIYKEAKPGLHIDHIIPLRGENVSGLHWHHNLQLLPATENMSKSNKFDSDSYVHQLPFY